MKELCDLCITILERCEVDTGISYAALNVWLFIIIQPLLIIFGCFSTIKCANTKNEKVKQNLKVTSILILVFGVLLVLYFLYTYFVYFALSNMDNI